MTRFTKKFEKSNSGSTSFEAKPLPTKSELNALKESQSKGRINKSSGPKKYGHSLKFCPKNSENNSICYHCGSDNHITKNCPTPGSTFPFATCFICEKKGHLSSKCPQNTKGLYPNGGGCRFCGSVNHLARDCKPTVDVTNTNTIGKMSAGEGGDDDDVFITLKKIQDERSANKLARSNNTESKKKVVQF
ncbi:hypothetical protein BB560_003229 [Smittium megazygosporum]|uniref:CCHC-type domain-containing protein n=1 Tax=Smittium megazygosporum TaxID=133381 RepID=A0A2T9ZCL1_9FUNG|nr:hypothetical protein BB560_003229 [Smittium megazygosporum]